jgi:hypothetical protein
MGWNELGYFELGKLLGAGNGLVLNVGGLGFRLLEKRLVRSAKWNKLGKWIGPLERGTGATTLDMSMGWLARCCTVSAPREFRADWAKAEDAIKTPTIAPAIHVPARMVRLLAKETITHPISMERGRRIASSEIVSRLVFSDLVASS